MKPWTVLGRGKVLGGTELVLSYRDGEYMLEADDLELIELHMGVKGNQVWCEKRKAVAHAARLDPMHS